MSIFRDFSHDGPRRHGHEVQSLAGKAWVWTEILTVMLPFFAIGGLTAVVEGITLDQLTDPSDHEFTKHIIDITTYGLIGAVATYPAAHLFRFLLRKHLANVTKDWGKNYKH